MQIIVLAIWCILVNMMHISKYAMHLHIYNYVKLTIVESNIFTLFKTRNYNTKNKVDKVRWYIKQYIRNDPYEWSSLRICLLAYSYKNIHLKRT